MNEARRDITSETDTYPTRVFDREYWTDRKDPVVWADWSEHSPISREQAQSYERNGYLVIRDAFSPAEIRHLQDAAHDLRQALGGSDAEDVITEPGTDAVRTIFRLERYSSLFLRLAQDARLAGIARFLMGEDVYIHQSRLNYKPGFTGKEFYWHSDFETWHAEDGMPRPRAVSASVLLTDNSALNGPLMLIPGSHRHFIGCAGKTPERNHETSLKAQKVGTPSHGALEWLVDRYGIDPAVGPAGTLIFFDSNTMHGSNGNITPFPRSNAFFVFNAVSNQLRQPYAAPNPRPEFLAERGRPVPLPVRKGPLA
jgi:ectoine hydroxylase